MNNFYQGVLMVNIDTPFETKHAEKSVVLFDENERNQDKEIIIDIPNYKISVGVIISLKTLNNETCFYGGNGRVFIDNQEIAFWSFQGFLDNYQSIILQHPSLNALILNIMLGVKQIL